MALSVPGPCGAGRCRRWAFLKRGKSAQRGRAAAATASTADAISRAAIAPARRVRVRRPSATSISVSGVSVDHLGDALGRGGLRSADERGEARHQGRIDLSPTFSRLARSALGLDLDRPVSQDRRAMSAPGESTRPHDGYPIGQRERGGRRCRGQQRFEPLRLFGLRLGPEDGGATVDLGHERSCRRVAGDGGRSGAFGGGGGRLGQEGRGRPSENTSTSTRPKRESV